jgi:hypothetical protein
MPRQITKVRNVLSTFADRILQDIPLRQSAVPTAETTAGHPSAPLLSWNLLSGQILPPAAPSRTPDPSP